MRPSGGAVSKDLSAPRARLRCTPRPFFKIRDEPPTAYADRTLTNEQLTINNEELAGTMNNEPQNVLKIYNFSKSKIAVRPPLTLFAALCYKKFMNQRLRPPPPTRYKFKRCKSISSQ
jgi:hypothetical protein